MNEIDEIALLSDREDCLDAAIDIAILVDDKYPGTYAYVQECATKILSSMYANVYTCKTQDIVV